MSLGDPTLDVVVFLASWLFLLGIAMIVATAVPAVQRRFPRIMFAGALVTLSSFLVVLLAWVLLG